MQQKKITIIAAIQQTFLLLFFTTSIAYLLMVIGSSDYVSNGFGKTIIWGYFGQIITYIMVYGLGFAWLNYRGYFLLRTEFLIKQEAFRTKNIFFLCLLSIGILITNSLFYEWKGIANFYWGANYSISTEYSNYEWSKSWLWIISLLIHPICEELFFRQYIFKKLSENYNNRLAFGVSMLLFISIYISFENPILTLPILVFGLCTTLIFYYTKVIWYSIILHFLFNFLRVVVNIFAKEYHNYISYVIETQWLYPLYISIGISFIVIGVKFISAKLNRHQI
jgi:membrane protease YdiL (CAAX protease family)